MKKIVAILMLCALCFGVWAEEFTMVVSKTDGTTVEILVSDVNNVTFKKVSD